jgi:hypothetical protein
MSAPHKITPLKVIIAALVILGAVVVVRYRSLPTDDYGNARDSFLRYAISFGSCGLAALVCISIGVLLFRAVRASRLHPALAVLLFIASAIGSAFIPVPLIPFVANFWSGRSLFSGDSGFMILAMGWLSALFAGAAVVAFLIAICFFRHSKHHETGA